jgi:hypothetical protein
MREGALHFGEARKCCHIADLSHRFPHGRDFRVLIDPSLARAMTGARSVISSSLRKTG